MGDNPSAFSTLSDEQLQNQPSPGRRKSDYLSASSSSLPMLQKKTPNRTFSSPRGVSNQKVVTIFDQIVNWFHYEIDKRKRLAALACGLLSAFSFILTVSVLKLSIWSPFGSIYDSLSWFLYPNQWLPIIFTSIVSTGMALAIIFEFCKVNQTPRIPITNPMAWVGVSLEFVHRLAFVYIAFYVSDSKFSSGFAWAAISFSLAISSALSVFRNDFHLNFSNIQVNSVKTLVVFVKSLPFQQLAEMCAIDAIIAFTASIALILTMGPVFAGFSTWWLFLNVPFHFILFALCFTHQFYMKMLMKVVNQIVMKPINFPFPPPYTVHSPTPEQTRTLPNVIDTDDPLLKIFALHDLRTIAWNDEKRRVDIFSLSQPGKHPRNWKAVSMPCVRALDELCSRMTVSAARLVGYSWDDHDAENDDVPRDALLMPRKMREMAYRGTNRQQRSMAPIRTLNTQTGGYLGYISKLLGFGPTEKLVISRFDAQVNAYAAEALFMLVVDSLGEDRFGVVQKDLKDLLSLLCKLIAALDNYERARASVADKSDVTFLRIVDSSLKASLQRVVTSFGAHLRSLNLAEEHVRTIRLVCLVDDI